MPAWHAAHSGSQLIFTLAKEMKIFLATVFLLLCVSICADAQQNVTMTQLIANPKTYDGKNIRVIGFLRLEFEGNVLYGHREDYENALLGNGIWVDANNEIIKSKKDINLKYVLFEGIFSSTDKGHMDMWSGSLTNITRYMLWSDPKKPVSGK